MPVPGAGDAGWCELAHARRNFSSQHCVTVMAWPWRPRGVCVPMKVKLFCIFALLLAAASASAEEWKRDFTVGAHPQLRVQANDARIEVRGTGGNTISARVVTDGWRIVPVKCR